MLRGFSANTAWSGERGTMYTFILPGGSYYLGDGSSSYHFYQYSNPANFYQVTSEDAISTGQTSGYLWADAHLVAGSIPAGYPKGHDAFYVMKYELSQAMYTEFLNCLNRIQQNKRTSTDLDFDVIENVYVMTGTSFADFYNGIRCDYNIPRPDPVEFWGDFGASGGSCLPCNEIDWPDVAAYLDWAGLRPMTELEYEKACRGPNYPVAGEYAWGNTLINVEDGGYYINAGSSCSAYIDFPQTDLGNCLYELTQFEATEIVRCGIFAGSVGIHTRTSTGAAYYGIMEMTGNVWEFCVNAIDNAGRSFTGLHGDGELAASGNGNVDYWPGMEGNDDESIANGAYVGYGIYGQAGIGIKGGYPSFAITGLPVSYRGLGTGLDFDMRTEVSSGRGVRTAP